MKDNKDQQKLFKCVVCKHKFYAQESDELKCPSCNSFNIALAKENTILTVLIKVLVFFVAGGVGFFLTPLIMGTPEEVLVSYVEEPVLPVVEDVYTQMEPCDSIEIHQDTIAQEIEIVISFDEVVNKDYIYSFDAHCNLDGQKTLTYELLDVNEDKVIMANADGKFMNIQPSATGEYRFRVCVEEDERISEPMLVTGFVQRPVVKVTPLSKEALESLINQLKSVYPKRTDILKNVEIKYTSSLMEEEAPKFLSQVEENIDMGHWAAVKVIDVDYNDINQVKMVLLEVVYP